MKTKIIQIKSEVVFLQTEHDEHLLQLIEDYMGRDMAELVRDKLKSCAGCSELAGELRGEISALRRVVDREKSQVTETEKRLAAALDDIAMLGGQLPPRKCAKLCTNYRAAGRAAEGKKACKNYTGKGSEPCHLFQLKPNAGGWAV